jgi:hypothetical protein
MDRHREAIVAEDARRDSGGEMGGVAGEVGAVTGGGDVQAVGRLDADLYV